MLQVESVLRSEMGVKMLRSAALLFLIGSSTEAYAGSVVLVSDTWDNIPVVEITAGLNAPNTPVMRHENVSKNWSSNPYQDRVCYRRSNNPSDPNSSLGPWKCAQQLTDGTYNFSLS